MNTLHFKRAFQALVLPCALATMSGCATVDNATQRIAHAVGIKNDTAASAVSGGAIGCGAGALIGHLLGESSLKGCAIGGAVGAISAVQVHQQQVAEARRLAAEAEAAGAFATVKTTRVVVADASGQKKPTESLGNLTIDLKPSDVRAHGSASAGILAKAARMADASADPITVEVEGTTSERAWMLEVLRGAMNPASKTVVEQQSSATPHLVLSPVPDVR